MCKLFGFLNEYFEIFLFYPLHSYDTLKEGSANLYAIVTKMDIYVGLQDLYDPWQERS